MSRPTNIVELAESLLADARERTKSASAPVQESSAHPIVVQLKLAAAQLRATADEDPVSLVAVQKLAAQMQPGTGAQSSSSGASTGAAMAAPTLPSLKTTNLGVTAGGGGAGPTMKVASELRKIATGLRASEENNDAKIAHVLNAACGLHYLREGLAP